jgi:hypothetical protein
MKVEKTKYSCNGEEVTSIFLENWEHKCAKNILILVKKMTSGNQNTEMNHRITQSYKAINTLNLIQWNKHIIKKLKINTYESVIINDGQKVTKSNNNWRKKEERKDKEKAGMKEYRQ